MLFGQLLSKGFLATTGHEMFLIASWHLVYDASEEAIMRHVMSGNSYQPHPSNADDHNSSGGIKTFKQPDQLDLFIRERHSEKAT